MVVVMQLRIRLLRLPLVSQVVARGQMLVRGRVGTVSVQARMVGLYHFGRDVDARIQIFVSFFHNLFELVRGRRCRR